MTRWWRVNNCQYCHTHLLTFNFTKFNFYNWRKIRIIHRNFVLHKLPSIRYFFPIKIVCDKVAEFIQLNFISSQQFGFFKGHSTLQQLVAYLSTILEIFFIFLDIHKASYILFLILFSWRSWMPVSLVLPGSFSELTYPPIFNVFQLITVSQL